MMEVTQQDDGNYAVRDVGGAALNDVLGLFTSRREAEEWLLNRSLKNDERDNGLDVMKPGNGQGL